MFMVVVLVILVVIVLMLVRLQSSSNLGYADIFAYMDQMPTCQLTHQPKGKKCRCNYVVISNLSPFAPYHGVLLLYYFSFLCFSDTITSVRPVDETLPIVFARKHHIGFRSIWKTGVKFSVHWGPKVSPIAMHYAGGRLDQALSLSLEERWAATRPNEQVCASCIQTTCCNMYRINYS